MGRRLAALKDHGEVPMPVVGANSRQLAIKPALAAAAAAAIDREADLIYGSVVDVNPQRR